MSDWERSRVSVDGATGFDRWRLDSGADGPRVVVLGGVHGDETEGILAAGALTAAPLDLRRGLLDVVPVCHEAAFARDSRTGPVDGGNLARVFPGNEDGGPTERLAWHLTRRVLKGADLLIDLHTSGRSYDMPFLAGFASHERDPGGLAERAATAFGADFVWHHPGRSPGRTLAVVDAGIYVECPGGGPTDRRYVERYNLGVLRVLRALDLLGSAVPRPSAPAVHVAGGGDLDRDMASVTQTGVFLSRVARGDAVSAGQVLGTVIGIRGEVLEEIRADTPGHVMALKRRSPVHTGDLVVCLASPTGTPPVPGHV